MKKGFRIYAKLFTSTFYLSSFTFGGGFVIVPLMRKKFVEDLHWIEEQEMMDLTAIAQSSPGAIAVNASILVGYRVAGILGALVCILGTILPPLILLSAISFFYQAFRENHLINAMLKGMQAGVAAVIADVTVTLCGNVMKEKRRWLSLIVMIGAFAATFFFKINVVYIILACAVIGGAAVLLEGRKTGGEGNA